MLTGKQIIRAGYGPEGFSIKNIKSYDIRFNKGKVIIRAGHGSERSLIKDF